MLLLEILNLKLKRLTCNIVFIGNANRKTVDFDAVHDNSSKYHHWHYRTFHTVFNLTLI